MASRTVSIVLTAQVQNYLANVKAAEDATRQLDARTKTMTETLRAQQTQLQKHHEAMAKLGVGMLAVGAAAAAGLTLAIKASTEFGAKMAQLQSLSHANADTMKRLSDAALSVGTAYGFSANQVADAQIELQKAGVSVEKQLGGALTGALTLAAAGQLDVAQATEITTVAMTQFGLSATDIPHLADLLSAGADKALGSVGDLGEALKNGGLQAHNMGMSIDDTVGLLSAFANAGILGAEAGTQMRSMFIALQHPSKQAQGVLDEYNIALHDQQGNFVGAAKLGDELREKLGGLTQAQRNTALATVFGSHAITGATVLYQDSGAAAEKAGTSIADWTRSVNDTGFAAAQAAGKMNSLQGDAQKLAAVFQTDLIKAGSGANDALRSITQTATGLLTTFGDIPGPVQNVIVAGTALTAGVGLLGGGFLIAVPKVRAFQVALQEMEITGKGAAGTFGKISGALIGITALMSAVQAGQEMGAANTGQISDAADSLSKRLANVDRLFKGNFLVGSGIKNAFDQELDGEAQQNKQLDGILFHMTKAGDVYRNHEGAFAALGSQLSGIAKINYTASTQSFSHLVSLVGAAGDKTKQLNLIKLLGPDYQHSLTGIAKGIGVTASQTNLLAIASGTGAIGQRALVYAQQQAIDSSKEQATTLAKLSGQASAATVDIDALQKTIEGFGSAQLDARGATRAMYQSIDDATAAVKKNGRTLDVHTQAGRDNAAALDDIATKADAAASKILKQTGSTQKASDAMKIGRAAYIKAAEAMGYGTTEAGKLADQIGLVPENITLAVKGTDLDPAIIKIKRIKDAMNALDGTIADVEVAVQVSGGSSATAAVIGRQLQLQSRAGGGSIDGNGPKGVDSVPAILAPGEHVLTAADVDRLGGQSGAYRFRSALASGAVQPFAAGGAAEQRRQAREDFVSAQRRGGTDPLSYVDEARSMSRDTAYSAGRRHSLDAAANRYESAIVKLTAASTKASASLDTLRSSSTQLRDSVSSSISGRYSLTGAGAQQTTSGWVMRDGIRYQTTTSGYSAAGIASYYTGAGRDANTFAADLKALAKRGLNPALLAQVAQDPDGPTLAKTLLGASSSQIKAINSGYSSVQAAAGAAGKTVADDTYAKQIAAAKHNADRITHQLRTDGEALRKLIARAFGLKGYATGTTSAEAGIRWVGENGPELVGFRGGEAVLNRADSARWVRGGNGGRGGQSVTVQAPIIHYPDTITVQDLSGFKQTMRVVARQEIAADAHADAVLMMGGAA